MIQLVATDIDGTLLDEHRSLSQQTLNAFKKIQHLPVVLISARMPQAMYYLQDLLDRREMPVICYNGALIKDQDEVIYSTTIKYAQLEQLAHIAIQHQLHVSIYRNDEWFVPQLDYWAQREINNTRVRPTVQDVQKTLDYFKETTAAGGAHKVMFMGDEDAMNLAFKEINDAEVYTEPGRSTKAESLPASLHLYRSKETYTEMSPLDISKKTALELLLKERFARITMGDVVAFGDNYNDVEMIRSVGYGVAVGNARDAVKEVARYETLHHKKHGVAHWLEKYIK